MYCADVCDIILVHTNARCIVLTFVLAYFTFLYLSSCTILGIEGRKSFLSAASLKAGWVGCCGSSVFLSHPQSRSSLVFPLPCTLTSLCCKLYWQVDEVPWVSGTQTICDVDYCVHTAMCIVLTFVKLYSYAHKCNVCCAHVCDALLSTCVGIHVVILFYIIFYA